AASLQQRDAGFAKQLDAIKPLYRLGSVRERRDRLGGLALQPQAGAVSPRAHELEQAERTSVVQASLDLILFFPLNRHEQPHERHLLDPEARPPEQQLAPHLVELARKIVPLERHEPTAPEQRDRDRDKNRCYGIAGRRLEPARKIEGKGESPEGSEQDDEEENHACGMVGSGED